MKNFNVNVAIDARINNFCDSLQSMYTIIYNGLLSLSIDRSQAINVAKQALNTYLVLCYSPMNESTTATARKKAQQSLLNKDKSIFSKMLSTELLALWQQYDDFLAFIKQKEMNTIASVLPQNIKKAAESFIRQL